MSKQVVAPRVIVTGGSGFVGTNLVQFLVAQRWLVRSFDIVQPRDPTQIHLWRNVNLLDRERLIREAREFAPSIVLHFGARTDLDEAENLSGYAANIQGVCNVLEMVRAVPSIERIIFASSQLVCRIGYTPKSEVDYQPSTLYGWSKALSEQSIRTCGDLGAVWTIVRPTSLWGPWFGTPYRGFFDAIARNLYVHPKGTLTPKQWGYVGNAVHQVWQLAVQPPELVHRRTFYLADYEPTTLSDFADKVQKALGARPVRRVPAFVLRLAALAGDLAQKVGWRHPPLTSFRYNNLVTPEIQNLDPLRQIVGPLPYTIEQGIAETVRWLRNAQNPVNRRLQSQSQPQARHAWARRQDRI